ncbi:hypothetical protein C0Q70_04016 [Pomacea canaliculata]|uniref:EF-hand domain-containing protein n=1 Tax=Pomacea canaliculata TaxID=400727 RepID=A0A2T7PUC1_POMCA|nr:hypothetical protein C0Q70_04016 [Pomacea canaliculata]
MDGCKKETSAPSIGLATLSADHVQTVSTLLSATKVNICIIITVLSDTVVQDHQESLDLSEPSPAIMEQFMVSKARELFQLCDTEEKGFITKRDMQRLKNDLPVSPEQLEIVFDSLDIFANVTFFNRWFSSPEKRHVAVKKN